MTCFQLPIYICKRIQFALPRLWWDNRSGNNKIAWIVWSKLILPKEEGGLEFRDIQSINDAYLTKISWRLIRKPECFLGIILFGKYYPSGDLISCSVSSSCSHGWCGIMFGRDIIVDNLGYAIGNGENLKSWDSCWLSLSHQERTMGLATESIANLKVSEMFSPKRNEWDLEKIRQALPFEEHKIIMLKPSLIGAPDKLVWL